ncbi:MAG: hypothetical protein GC181_10410 [Bacteroidetes bacterium]|nr:hypothetical protein [Bacteroidota bacterium]
MFPSTDEYTVHFELKEAIECAKKCGKPLFIQFTGHDVKIDETDELIINSTAIREKLYRDFIWLQMYLDDKRDADPEDYVLT